MVNISVSSSGFMVMGHANQAEHGYDIVCSAISALTQTTALTLNEEYNAKVTHNNSVYLVEVNKRKDGIKLLLRNLVRGLEKIEEEYPKHIKLRIQRGVMKNG